MVKVFASSRLDATTVGDKLGLSSRFDVTAAKLARIWKGLELAISV